MYTPPASNYTGGFGPACGGSGDTITTGFRAPFHKSFSQLSALTTARRMIDQGTYRSSACPYECLRKITRHEVVPSNEANMLSGLGMLGEGFIYPGHDDDPGKGFSRYASSGEAGDMPKLHPLHMSHNVTMDQCDEIVHRHQLLAPHGVWLVNHEHEAGFATGERLGDCGLFLGARSAVDADIWRAFYKYARMILRLGHVDTWFDDDIIDAIVHTSSEKVCNSALSKVCLWWSEFDLDDEEYSCRPKRDASNIVTPSILLATLAENRVAYPPPSPPPPFPPSLPPAPSPPPGSIRCELSGVASTKGYKVPAFDAVLNEFVPVQKKCWRWDASNDWPPFVAHRDLYRPRDRCSGDRSRDVQWDGGFRQSILSKNAYDSLHQNNDDCPWKSRMGHDYLLNRGRMEDGAKCSDGSDGTKIVDQAVDQWCTLGTNLQSCGIRKNLVVFGYGYAPRYMEPDDNLKSAANAGQDPSINYWANTPFYKARDGFGTFRQSVCIGLPAWSDGKAPSTAPGKWVYTGEDNSLYADIGSNPAFGSTTPLNMRPDWDLPCRDGGPGSEFGAMCYYGTDANCGKRRFAFEFDQAGPDIPDNSCVSGTQNWKETIVDTGAVETRSHTYGPNNGVCEDGLMWSVFPPGRNPCAPNTDLSDCGWRPAKRYVRMGPTLSSDTCEVPNHPVNPTNQDPHDAAAVAAGAVGTWTSDPDAKMEMPCADYSDDLFHGNDLRLRTHRTSWNAGTLTTVDDLCGRGTQTKTCQRLAEAELEYRFEVAVGITGYQDRLDRDRKIYGISSTWGVGFPYSNGAFLSPDNPYPNSFKRDDGRTSDGQEGTLAYASYKYQEKDVYANPNQANRGACVSPINMLHNAKGELVRPRMFHSALYTNAHLSGYTGNGGNWGASPPSLAQEHTVWFDESDEPIGESMLKDNMRLWPLRVCSDGGEGSVRVPMEFGVAEFVYRSPAGIDTKFFYDFGCPYGSQPEACGKRMTLEDYAQTTNEVEQPSGPAFSNCFDDDVPDYECCHAENQFIIHGGPGLIGQTSAEELQYCALTEAPSDPGVPNTRNYPHSYGGKRMSDLYMVRLNFPNNPDVNIDSAINPSRVNGVSLKQCKALCDNFGPGGYVYNWNYDSEHATYDYEDFPNNYDETLTCNSIGYNDGLSTCELYYYTHAEYSADSRPWTVDSNFELHFAEDSAPYEWPEENNGQCPLHWTSYHHTSTGCEAFCRNAFQREGEDNTCMPAYPECANWLPNAEFPNDKYVTVNAECICGAKLEELQPSGKYVHTGTILARERKRALHEDDGVDDGRWEWPDDVTQGVDEFHGKTFSLEHTHTHTRTHTHTHTHARSLFVCRRPL